MKKRILSLFLALTLCLTLLPTAAFAEGETGGEGSGHVAKVGDTEYETLQEILEEMEPVEITLLRDVEAEDTLEVYAATTINMNGFSITGDIDAADSLTLKGGTVKGKVTVDAADGTFTMTAPADAGAAIDGGLNVVSGSCSVSGAKIGVNGTLFFGGTDMTITGTDKAVELTAAAEPSGKKFHGSTNVDGDTAEEATFDGSTYQVSGGVAKKLSYSSVTPEPSDPTLTLSPTEKTINAGETATFTATYDGTGELNAYIQKNGLDTNFTVNCVKDSENENTYTISVKTDVKTFTGTYELIVHEVGDSLVQAKAKIHIEGLTPVAEVDGVKYALLTEAFAAAKDGDTVKLLANHMTDWDAVDAGDESMAVVAKTLTLDLNGKTVDYLVVGEVVSDEEGGILESTDGNLTIKDSVLGSVGAVSSLQLKKGKLTIEAGEIGTAGNTSSFVCSDENGEVNIKGGLVWFFGCEGGGTANITGGKVYQLSVNPTGDDETVVVNISGGTSHGGRNDGTNYDSSTWSVNGGILNITGGTFGKVLFNYTGGNVDISGGTFQSISNSGASASAPVASLLADECAFYGKDTDGQYTVLKDGTETSLTDVTVKEHTHNVVNGACGCGLQFEAMITDAKDNSKLYTKLADAAAAMQDGETLTLLADVDVSGISGGLVFGHDNTTFDLGGHKLYSSTTLNEFEITAILKIDAAWATVTLKNGKIEVNQDIYALAVWMTEGHLTLDGITVTAAGIRTNGAVHLSGTTNATIVSGDYQGLYLDHTASAVLKGGTFRPYEKRNGSIGHSISHQLDSSGSGSRDCMELLAEGYVYVNEAREQVRTYGGFDYTVTVQSGTDKTAAVAKIGATKYPSLREAIKEVQDGETIELLQNLDLGSGVVQLEDIDKDFTIDLGNYELKANAQYLVYMMEGKGHVTIQNGTLNGSSCTSYTIFVCGGNFGGSPKLILKNVTATANGKRPVVQVVANGTVEFDGGKYIGGVLIGDTGNAVLKRGTFEKGQNEYSIKTSGNNNKTLSDYLDVESLFWKDNAPLDLSSVTETADEVTVRPCEHNWVNGKCTICKKGCDHGAAKDGSMPAEKCPTCGMKAAAGVVIDASEKYFLTFDKALACAAQNNGCTLKLLANVVDVTVTTEKPFIFDLNGHTVHRLTVNSKITLKDSSGGSGQIVENLIVEVKGMSVGELLEEGYAFRSCLDGSWPVATVQTVGNVSILPAPIKSVTAEKSTVAVEYGKTADVTLTATVVPSAEDGTVNCQWYTAGGTASPIEGATGSSYQLPDDLDASTYTYRLTATKDGYSKSADITVTVKKANLSNAVIEFPYGDVLPVNPVGATGVPTFTVKYNGKELEQFKDFEITEGGETNVLGTCTLTVTAAENSNYTESKSAEWTVRPLKIKLSSRTIEKTYDGTTDLPANAKITFESAENMYAGQTIGLGKGTDYQLDTSYDSPDAGEEKTVSGIVKLLCKNFVFDDGTEAGTSEKGFTLTGKINKAAIDLNSIRLEQYVYNDLAKTYEIDLKTLLDKILLQQKPAGVAYGQIEYPKGVKELYFTDSTYHGGTAVMSGSTLSLPIAAANSSKGEIGTVTVAIKTTNYQDFELTLHIIAQDKITPNQKDVTVSASGITYGQTLSESQLVVTGKMLCPRTGKEITGTFAWKDGAVKPEAGSYEAEWTFTPDKGYEEYAVATGTVTVKVDKAEPTFTAPTANTLTYTGSEQALLTAGSTQDGTMLYRLGESGEFTDRIPTGKDAGTYTVYYQVVGDINHNDTDAQPVSVTIGPLPISLLTVEKISKTYDGTASVTLSTDMLTFFSKAAGGSNITLPDTALSFPDARFTMEQKDGGYVDSPEVGGGKALSFTMTLESDNYVFEREPEGTKTVSTVFATDADRFTITKADAPTATAGTLNVINGTEQSYTYDFKQLLPALDGSKTYGAASYTLNLPFTLADGYTTSGEAKLTGSVLTLPVKALDTKQTGRIGTIEVPVVTDNYKDFKLTLDLYAVNKIKLTPCEITCSDITYGDPLSMSTITGTMYAEGDTTKMPVAGKFAWGDANVLPTDGSEVYFTFTPDDGNHYEVYEGKLTIHVNQADISTGAQVSIPTYYYNGQPQKPSVPTISFGGKTLCVSQDYMVSVSPETNVGTYATMKITGIGNYTGEISGLQWAIEPNPITPAIEVTGEYFYTGEAIIPTFTVTYGDEKTILPASEYTVSYGSNTNAGTGTVTVTTKGNYLFESVTGQFRIAKADSTATAPTANDLTYNGTDRALVTAGTANGGTMVYSQSEDGTYTTEIPNGKNAGDYTVWYKVQGDDNHNDTAPQSVSATIAPASVTVTAENKSSRVGQPLAALTYTCQLALFDGDAFTGALACKADKNKIGSYDITQGSLALSGNYAVTFVKGTYIVEAKLQQSDFKFEASTKTVTYGDVDFTFAATGAAEGSTVTYSSMNERVAVVDNDGTVRILKAGETTITAAASETADYGAAVTSYDLTVNKAVITIAAKNQSARVGDNAPALGADSYTVTGLVNGEQLKTAPTARYVDDSGNEISPDMTKTGEVRIAVSGAAAPDDDNYTISYVDGTLTITSRPSSGSSTTAPVITVPVSSDKETVKVDASVSNGVATVKATDRQLEQVTTDTDTVTVDVSGLQNVSSAKLPSSIIEKAEQSGAALTVTLPTGSVTLDAVALAAVGNGKDVTISVQKAALTDAQRDAVGSMAQVAIVVDVNVLTGTAKRSNFNGGKLTVSIPYTLKSGEDPTKLQVWFIRDDGSIENMSGSYDRKTGCFVFSTEHLSCYLLVSTAGTQRFADVPASAYYAEAVAWAVKNGITGGISATTFDPNGFCTRAQAVTFLWRAAGSPTPESTAMPFTDVPAGSYYYDAVLWAIENDITKGMSETAFSPNVNCSRGQIVTFLWRSQKSPDAAAANPFTDVAADAYYTSAVLWAVEKNITGGTSTTTFSPSTNCIRAQIVTFLHRMYQGN